MNMLYILIKRELLKLKSSILLYLIILFFSPLFMYLFISIPLSFVINMKPIYLYWSSSSIWLISAIYIAYLFSYFNVKRNLESDSFRSLPILSWQLIVSNYILVIMIGILQLIVSILILNTLNKDFLSLSNYLVLIIFAIPCLLIVSSFSFIFFCTINNKLLLSFVNAFIFIVLSFGYGAFIPIKYFPVSYYKIVSYFPIVGTISNYQRILKNENIYFSSFITDVFFALFLFFVVFYLCEKKMKNQY